jgi:hypothetical protein
MKVAERQYDVCINEGAEFRRTEKNFEEMAYKI